MEKDIQQNGKVNKISGTFYYVLFENKTYTCTIRGKVKRGEKLSRNIISCGDDVLFNIFNNNEEGVIEKILPRRNKISRAISSRDGTIEHIIASNIDQLIIVNAIDKPIYKSGFVDRLLIVCEKENIKPVILINKTDLVENLDEWINTNDVENYKKLGYEIFYISCYKKTGINEILDVLKGKISFFIGQSGVGKSSLLNAILDKNIARVSEVSSYSNKGKHTTSNSEMLSLPFEGSIIDSPGLREFAIYGISKSNIGKYFKEFNLYSNDCAFSGCSHTHEPECGIKKSVQEKLISPERYKNYVNIFNSLD